MSALVPPTVAGPLPPARSAAFCVADEQQFLPSAVQEQSAVAAVTARARGAATRLVGLAWLADTQLLVVRGDSGLRRVRDLADQRIGLPPLQQQCGAPRAHALRGAAAALETAGLHHRHVQWTGLPPLPAQSGLSDAGHAPELQALCSGAVDAVYVRGAAGLIAARAAGARVLFDIGAHRDSWVRMHTALLQAFTIADTCPGGGAGTARQLAQQVRVASGTRTGLDPAMIAVLDALKAFLARWGFVRGEFRTECWLDPRMPEAAPAQAVPARF